MKNFFVAAISCSLLLSTAAHGQDWRQESSNPNQPNGYRASEFASHYHGDLHLPAQHLNGYHASEARSHYGGSRFEPASGWSYQSNSGPGSAFTNNACSGGGPGSAYSNASWYQNGGAQNSLAERMQRANRWQRTFRNLEAAGYVPGASSSTVSGGGAQTMGGENRFSTFMPLVQRESQLREQAEQRVENGSRGFNRVYTGE